MRYFADGHRGLLRFIDGNPFEDANARGERWNPRSDTWTEQPGLASEVFGSGGYTEIPQRDLPAAKAAIVAWLDSIQTPITR